MGRRRTQAIAHLGPRVGFVLLGLSQLLLELLEQTG